MTLQHRTWHQNGRTFDIETGQRLYTSRVGQAQVDVAGAWSPYVWHPGTRIIDIADVEVRFTATAVEFWKNRVQLGTFGFHPEVFRNSQWNRPTPTVSDVTVEEVDTEGPDRFLTATYTLSITGYTVTVTIQAGGSHKIHLGIEATATQAGTYRVAMGFPVAARAVARERRDRQGNILEPTHYAFNGLLWRFKPEEIPNRRIISDSTDFRLDLAEKAYARDEKILVRPDTLGPTGIGDAADDGVEIITADNQIETAGTWDSTGWFGSLYLADGWAGNGENPVWLGLRWRNINLGGTPASIDAGTQIGLTNGADNSGETTINWRLRAVNNNNPAVWGATTARPSQRSYTTAQTTGAGSTGNITPSVQTPVQEMRDAAFSWSGTEAIAFALSRTNDPTGQPYWNPSNVYDGAGANVEATLTIVYTPAAGGQTFFQTLPATAIGVATLATLATHARSLTVQSPGVATMTRVQTAARTLSVQAPGLASLTRTMFTTLSATEVSVPLLSAVRTYSRTLSATAVGVAELLKEQVIGVTLSAIATSVATLTKLPGKVLSVAAVGVATMQRGVGKTLLATAEGIAALATITTHLRTLSVQAPGVATLTKVPGKVLSATATGVAALIKVPGKVLSVTVAGVPTLTKIPGKVLSVTATGVASLSKGFLVTLSATVTSVASLAAQFLSGGPEGPGSPAALAGWRRRWQRRPRRRQR